MQTEFDTPFFSDYDTIPNYMITEWFLPDPYFIWCAKRSGTDFMALRSCVFIGEVMFKIIFPLFF